MKRRETSTSLSFLDCICCGFGAIILLFILAMGATATIIRESQDELERMLEARLAAFSSVQSVREQLSGELAQTRRTIEDIIEEIEELVALISTLTERIAEEQAGKEKLLVDLEEVKREVAAMQKKTDIPQLDATTPIGVPVESNYIAFVIDTSGSMRDPMTGALYDSIMQKFGEVLSAYPEAKGIQFLDADGRFIVGRAGEWLPDTPAARQTAASLLRRYGIHSNSNPVPGIRNAIRALHDKSDEEMKMGIYIFGDEFTETAEQALEGLDRLNPADEDGKRQIQISAIGFPNLLGSGFFMGQSGLKFANLMRELTFSHGGAFIVVID